MQSAAPKGFDCPPVLFPILRSVIRRVVLSRAATNVEPSEIGGDFVVARAARRADVGRLVVFLMAVHVASHQRPVGGSAEVTAVPVLRRDLLQHGVGSIPVGSVGHIAVGGDRHDDFRVAGDISGVGVVLDGCMVSVRAWM